MLIRLEDVHKSFGSFDVLKGASFQINPGEHTGLVGRNGAGKTTIFRMLAGREEPDTGRVLTSRGLRLGLLDQQPVFDPVITVREEALRAFAEIREMEQQMLQLEHAMAEASGEELAAIMSDYSDLQHRHELLGGFSHQARAEAVLSGLGFSQSDFDAPAARLSGGQKARLALARLLLSQPDILLLDEPTNHLDISASEWLEEFLISYSSAFVIISHDRFLLDRVATRIVEVENGKSTAYTGNYSAFVKQKQERILAQTREYEKQQELITRTEEFIRRNIAGQKTKQAKSRRNMLERMDRVEAVETDSRDFGLKIEADSTVRSSVRPAVLNVSDLDVGYPGNTLSRGISFILQQGDRLGIIGPNGCGKTTFLKTILGTLQPVAGGLVWNSTAKLAYYEQELSNLDLQATVADEIGKAFHLSSRAASWEGELRNFLARFNFTGEDAFKPVGALSGGERSRVALAKLVCSRANVLLLDEPTNHLDIVAREAVETALQQYHGTIIVVSHDRYFLDKVASGLLVFENGTATFHYGGYLEYYRQKHAALDEKKNAQQEKTERESKSKATAERPRKSKSSKDERSLTRIEEQIHQLEQELATLTEQLSNPAPGASPQEFAEVGARHQTVSSELEELYEQWQTLAESVAN